MTIKSRMFLMGLGLVIAFGVLGAITHQSNISVEQRISRNDDHFEDFLLSQTMRQASLELAMAAKDAMADRARGTIAQERMAVIEASSDTLVGDAARLLEAMESTEDKARAEQVRADVDALVATVRGDLKVLIEAAGSRQAELVDAFASERKAIHTQGEAVAHVLDTLAKRFSDKLKDAKDNAFKAAFAAKAVNAIDEMRVALSRLILASMDVLAEGTDGTVAADKMEQIQKAIEYMDSKLPLLASFMTKSVEYDMLDTLEQDLPWLFESVRVELVDLIRDAGAEREAIAREFIGMSDLLHAQSVAVISGLEGIGDALLGDVRLSNEQLHADMERSDTLSLVVSLSAMLGVAVLFTLFARSILGPTGRAVRFAEAVASGDLERDLDVRGRDEIGQLAASLRTMVHNLKEMIAQADAKTAEAYTCSQEAEEAQVEAKAAEQRAIQARRDGLNEAADRLEALVSDMSSASEELSAQVEQVTWGTRLQSERMGETANAMEHLNTTVLDVARSASEASDFAEQAREQATGGAQVVDEVVAAIHGVSERTETMAGSLDQLGEQAEGIGQVMNVITDIADQTNLLALNAAIEAARAGEAGRGFAVVADEVRKLAEKTMSATKEVGAAVRAIQDSARANIEVMGAAGEAVEQSTGLAGEAGAALRNIVAIVDRTSDQVRSIATASEEQSAASDQINQSVETVSSVAAETAQGMGQAGQAIGELARLASDLQGVITSLRQG